MSLKKDFIWGAASAAAQIEGAYNEDGRGLSIWDVLYDGNTKHNDSPHEACDHYHHFKEDVALMKEIGLKYYRLSISWSRLLPNGTGEVNQKGVDFYNRLFDELLAAGIEPIVTIYHWDLPYELYKKGGWQNDESPLWFEEYTKLVISKFSDRVRYWITLNEPNCFIGLGYKDNCHAPFLNDKNALIACTRNVCFAHAKAVKAIRENAKITPIVGYAPTGCFYLPENDSKVAYDKAYNLTFSNKIKGPFAMGWWCDPVILGKTPKDVEEYLNVEKLFSEDELEQIRQPLDFLGYNVYTPTGEDVEGSFYQSVDYPGRPRNTLFWPIEPDIMYYTIRFIQDRYNLPLLITENGYCGNDFVMLDGKVHDPQRIDYVHRHLLALKKAVSEGYNVIGYLYWSIMDNYEWSEGYDPRFGLIYVDYKDQRRILKDSAYWYKEVISTNGNNL